MRWCPAVLACIQANKMICLVRLGCVFDLTSLGQGIELDQLVKVANWEGIKVNEMFEILDLRTEQANQDERFSIEETIRSVFGNDVEVIEFIPYGEGN